MLSRLAIRTQPITPDNVKRMKRTPQVKVIRRAIGLSQEEFMTRYLFRSARCGIGNKAARNLMPRLGPILQLLPAIPKAVSDALQSNL